MSEDGFGYVKVKNNKICVVSGSMSNEVETFYDNPKWVSALKLQELVQQRIKKVKDLINFYATVPSKSLENELKILQSLLEESQNTVKEEIIVVDVKCICGHWGYEHPLFDSDKKRQCTRKCQCDNYIENTDKEEGKTV